MATKKTTTKKTATKKPQARKWYILANGEDLEWLKRVLPGKRKKFSDKIVYTYAWNANPDSLYKRYNRGEIKQERA